MSTISNINGTTELEAINSMLAAIGESPVTDINGTQADLQVAVNLLRNATREVQSVPWKFNYETGVQLAPAGTVVWTDVAANITTLNVFTPPANTLSWKQSRFKGNGDLILTARPSKQYRVSTLPVVVLYDKKLNRDGADIAWYPYVWIDVIFGFDFDQMPESARRYATVVAGRRFTQQVVGSETMAGFQELDERIALRTLKRDQGETQRLNMLDNYAAFTIMGQRPRMSEGWSTIGVSTITESTLNQRVDDSGNSRVTD